MLKTKILHPDLLYSLARMGHGSQILIADGNFPFETESPATAHKVFLNLTPGIVNVTDVLKVLADSIEIEDATFMATPDDNQHPVYDEFKMLLPESVSISKLKRFDFYHKVKSPKTALVIATGETRRFANLLLTVGVVSGNSGD